MKYIFLLFSFLPLFMVAQQSSKLNIDLYLELQEIEQQHYMNHFVPVLIKGDLAQIEQLVKEDGGNYKYGVKNIASAQVSLATVQKLLLASTVKRVEYRKDLGQQLSFDQDTMLAFNNNLTNVHLGAGLPQSFQGEGVLLGIIDDGFEWQHPDFRQADSSTRIMHLWDQTSTDLNFFESGYGYGASWDSMNLNAYQCSHTVGAHGSHVMGTAGGNGFASGKYVGVAPKADLACVRVESNNAFLPSFVDGIHYLFQKADAAGQACAINSSVGSYGSGHDGKDLYAQLIDHILTAKAGRALIQAGGNARAYPLHLGVNLNNTLSKTRFKYHGAKQKTHFNLYADTSGLSNVDFSFQLIDPQTQQIIAQTPSYNVLQDFTFGASIATLSQVLFTDNTGNPVVLNIMIDQYEDAYEVEVDLESSSNLGHWQLTTSGVGKYDIWSDEIHLGTSNMLKNVNTPNYTSPDSFQTIVGYWTCSDKVISVGAYQNRDAIVTWGGDTIDIGTVGFPQFGIAAFSSLGPTRTGLQKPDITAPGGQVVSAAPLNLLNYYKSISDFRLDEDGWHVVNRGTSMAAPMVAGAVALYLQCKPYADVTDIKQALENSARVDPMVLNEVLAIPNIHWGYGKLDIYKLVESCLIYGCNDSTALNYNPLATVSDSSCFYVGTGVRTLADQTVLTVYPNPFVYTATIDYQLPSTHRLDAANLSLYNALGQKVFYQEIDQRKGTVSLDGKELPKGAYWLVLENEGKKYAHQQLIYL